MISNNRYSAIESNNAFTAKVEDLVREIVIQNNILYYRIESRVEHLANTEGEDSFMPVIRVITYFEDTVSQISDLLHTEFEVIAESSVDKKKSRVESFSYKHIQYLVCLQANRRELTEYKRSGDKRFEIQICSMLQDAWAGIEKELGYDSESFPEEGKRDLYRVGALLEMADLEFLKIRSKFISEPVAKQPEPVIYRPVVKRQEAVEEAHAEIKAQETIEEPVSQPEPEAIADVAPVTIPKVFINEVEPELIIADHEEIKEFVAEQFIVQPEVAEVIAPEAAAPEAEYIAPVAVMQSIVPKRVIPVSTMAPAPVPTPAPAPVGVAPKRTIIDVAKNIAASVIGAAFSSEHKNVVNEKAPEVEYEAWTPPSSIARKEPAPQAVKAPELQVAAVVPPPAPVVEEVPQSKVEAPVIPQPQSGPQHTINVEQLKVHNVENMKVNLNGNIEKAAEINNVTEESVPFFEDLMEETQVKAVKPAPLDENAPITDVSLKEYVLKSKLLKEVDKQIAERAGAKINQEIDIEGDVERLRFLKVYTLKQLHDRIKDNTSDIVSFAEKWIGKDNGGSFDSGISLFYLEYLLVGKKNDPAFAVEYVVKFISDNDYSARYIIPTYNSIRNTEAPNFSHLTLK